MPPANFGRGLRLTVCFCSINSSPKCLFSNPGSRLVCHYVTMNHADVAELTLWAAGCAHRVLSSFESRHRADQRPRRALEAAEAWARGELKAEAVRELARGAERAARESQHPAAIAAARACAEAAYLSRGAHHAQSAAAYARVAIASENEGSSLAAVSEELQWQRNAMPNRHLHLLGQN
jgi:hypothetical protein